MATTSTATIGPGAAAPRKRKSRRPGIGKILMLIFLTIVAIFYLIPVYVMVVNGFKEATNVSLSRMWELPENLSAGGYAEAWDRLSPNLSSSIQLVIPATILSGLFGALNGYLLSKWKFRGSDVIFTLMLFGMFIPY
ncbi:MAG TPA: hypothetical protein VKZ61_11770, partial [Thermomicrobiales bacterium]|nr:hypothetical protein [Thermomicrobiales bacterium]